MDKMKTIQMQFLLAMLLGVLVVVVMGYYTHTFNHDYFWLFRDWHFFVMSILLQPIIEEISFRGWIQGFLLGRDIGNHRWWLISSANVITTLLFGVIHLVYHTPIWAFLVTLPSLLYGYFRERFDSVIPAIVLHIFYNLTYFSLLGMPSGV